MRESSFIQYDMYFNIIGNRQVKKINIDIFFKSLTMNKLAKKAAVCLVIKIFDALNDRLEN
jgi:hypothetical protein